MRRKISLLYFIGIFTPGLLSAQSKCPPPNPDNAICSIDDTFRPYPGTTVTYLNQRLWRFEGNNPSGITLFTASVPTGLQITAPVGAAGRGIFSVCSGTEDFDVRVDYKLSGALYPYEVRLGAIELGTGPFGEVGIHRNSSAVGGDVYTMVFVDGNFQQSTSDSSGTLRLVRSGCTTTSGCVLQGFKRFPSCGDIAESTCSATDPSWVAVGAPKTIKPDATRFNLDVATANPAGSGGLTASFTNFKFTGTIECPSVAARAAGNATGLETLAKQASNRPNTYALGGKGFSYFATARDQHLPGASGDCATDPLGCDHYLRDSMASQIFSGYWFQDCEVNKGCPLTFPIPPQISGIDCSGLVLWSYNTAAGATTKFQDANPIYYPGADGQYLNNVNPTPVSVRDLQPGDLLFFNYGEAAPGHSDHVAMYVGNGQTVEAYNETLGVISRQCDPANGCERSTKDPVNVQLTEGTPVFGKTFSFLGFFRPLQFPVVSLKFQTHSPIRLSVTDPDGFLIDSTTRIVTSREILHEIPGQLYYIVDSSEGSRDDDTVISPSVKLGPYLVMVIPKPGASPSDTYSLTVQTATGTTTLANHVPITNIPGLGYGVEFTGSAIQPFVPVAIDIKPGSANNTVNLASPGKIPVAILSGSGFDALTIDQSSLNFGRFGNEASFVSCGSGEDVDGDGITDLVCQFYTQRAKFDSSDTKAVLTGRTKDGRRIRGSDSVRILHRDNSQTSVPDHIHFTGAAGTQRLALAASKRLD